MKCVVVLLCCLLALAAGNLYKTDEFLEKRLSSVDNNVLFHIKNCLASVNYIFPDEQRLKGWYYNITLGRIGLDTCRFYFEEQLYNCNDGTYPYLNHIMEVSERLCNADCLRLYRKRDQ
jgi:hypothetical protein